MLVGSCQRCGAPATLRCAFCGRTYCINCLDSDERLCSECLKRQKPERGRAPPAVRPPHRVGLR